MVLESKAQRFSEHLGSEIAQNGIARGLFKSSVLLETGVETKVMQSNLPSGSIEKPYRILLIDDHPIVRQGLSLLIDRESDLSVCGEAADAHSAFHAIATLRPDMVVLDLSLSGPDGLDVLKEIRLKSQSLPVLILSVHDESIYAERALRAGADGYIMKEEPIERVLAAIRKILQGKMHLSDRQTSVMVQQLMRRSGPARSSSVIGLTDRELEVFRLIGEGHGTRQIADELHLSVKTIESHQAHIKEKLALKNSRELVQHAIEWTVSEHRAHSVSA